MMHPMIRHHVITTLNDNAKHMAPEIVATLHEWVKSIPECTNFQCGVDAGLTPGAGDLAVMAEFASADDYRVYANDEEHQRIIKEMIAPNAASIVRCQTEY